VWGDFMLAMDNEPLADNLPDGVALANACGRSNIPFIGDSASRAGCGGGGGGGSKARGEGDKVAKADAVQPKEADAAPPPKPKPKGSSSGENHFMSDFFN
jgi:penicillin-binding protein 1B